MTIILIANEGDSMSLNLTNLETAVTALIALNNTLKANQTNPADQAAVDALTATVTAATGA